MGILTEADFTVEYAEIAERDPPSLLSAFLLLSGVLSSPRTRR